MTNVRNSAFSGGFGLLWRRQGLLWWIFVVNLVCGALGTLPAFLALHGSLSHSLAGQPLANRFDLGMLDELTRLPEVRLMRNTIASYLFAFVFFAFMLFVSGGILESYRADRRLTTGEFFAASGGFFWRFVRLLLLSLVPFVIVGMIYQGLYRLANYAGDRAISDYVGVSMRWGAALLFLLLALAVRLWFDMAQVRAVAHNEHRMWRNTWRAGSITGRHFGALYWMYLRIALLAWLTLAVGLVIWAKLPATATGAVFILLELIMFAQIATRLWQLAGATSWYQQHPEMLPAETPAVTPLPSQEPVSAIPAPALPVDQVTADEQSPGHPPPPGDPGPELPPADA